MRESIKIRRLAGICDIIKFGTAPTSKERIRQELMTKTGYYICVSQIEKDLYTLKNLYEAPIKYVGTMSVGYVMTDSYSFWAHYLMKYKADLNLPHGIVCIIEKNLK